MNPVGLIYFALAVLAAILVFAVLRLFFKRMKCGFAVRSICRRCGLKLQARPLWWLGSRYARGVDCIIQAGNCTFAVKLFGCLWPLKSLIFRAQGEYFFRAHSTFLAPLLDVLDGYPHALPEYRFPGEGGREVCRILLINPAPLEILLQPASGPECISGPGDQMRGMEIANLPHLLRNVENAAEKSAANG